MNLGLKKVIELQKIDHNIREIEDRKKEVPRAVAELDQELEESKTVT